MPFSPSADQEKALPSQNIRTPSFTDLCPKRPSTQLQISILFYILIFMGYLYKIIFFTFFLYSSNQAVAQESSGSSSSSYEFYFDLGLKTGTFLPSKINGVRDVLPLWGVKMGHPISQELALEYDVDIAHAKGVQYFLGYLSLRHNFAVGDAIPLFVLVGFDGHYYKRKNSLINQTEFPFKLSTGWHVGVGGEAEIYRDLLARIDFRMGFSPGRQMTMTFGVVFRW